MGKSRSLLIVLMSFVSVLLFQNCSSSPEGGSVSYADIFPYSRAKYYFKSTQKVVVEVYYEPGAEPFIGTTASGMNYWQILEDNLNSIFQYRNQAPIVVVPRALSDMKALAAQGRSEWSGNDIMNLYLQNHSAEPSSSEARFYLYFLKGYYNSGAGANTGIIGVSITGTPVIAIFKQVVQSTGNSPNGIVPKYVEQSTMVHEMGHALGFVNNGVPMAAAHQDTAHGAHTTNSQCVMYWLNEGASDLSGFIQHYITSGNTVMWGSEVLSDAQGFSE